MPEIVNTAPADTGELKERIVKVIRTIFDPEIPVNIYDLGLIYNIGLDEANNAKIEMTLTAPNCPAAGTLPGEVENKVRAIPGVTECKVEIVWEPPWSKDLISEAAKLDLGID